MSQTGNRADTGRDAKGRFTSCGNPKGRPKKPAVIKKYAKESVKELYKIATDAATPTRLRAEIWRWFFEIEFGKPAQQIASEGGAAPVISVVIPEPLKDFAG